LKEGKSICLFIEEITKRGESTWGGGGIVARHPQGLGTDSDARGDWGEG